MLSRIGFRRVPARPAVAAGDALRHVGLVDGALGGDSVAASTAAQFPDLTFIPVGRTWPERPPAGLDLMIAAVDGGSAIGIEQAVERLRASRDLRVIVVLRQADVMTTRQLIREGAADVLPAPVSEAALVLSLERLLGADRAPESPPRRPHEVVAVLKAGGGVGATTLTVHAAAMAAGLAAGEVCVADLDLQFGCAGLYLDADDGVTITDCLAADEIAETPFAAMLAQHRSGLRVLAAPHELTPLEALTPQHVDALLSGLRRDFELTLLDLPTAWTAWTYRALQQTDRIVVVTRLSVPHIHLLRRQLTVLASQGLMDRPVILVCNGVSSEQLAVLPIKTAERAIGRAFDVCIPEDRATMNGAVNEGVDLAKIRRRTRLEKALSQLADLVHAPARQPVER